MHWLYNITDLYRDGPYHCMMPAQQLLVRHGWSSSIGYGHLADPLSWGTWTRLTVRILEHGTSDPMKKQVRRRTH